MGRWQTMLGWATELGQYNGAKFFKGWVQQAGCDIVKQVPLLCQVMGNSLVVRFREEEKTYLKALTYMCPETCGCGTPWNGTKRPAHVPAAMMCPAACTPCRDTWHLNGSTAIARGGNQTTDASCEVATLAGQPPFEAVMVDARCCNLMTCAVAYL